MTRTITKSRKPADAMAKPLNGGATSNGAKIPVRDTLPNETDPEMLRAYRLLAKAAAAVRENLANMEPEGQDRS